MASLLHSFNSAKPRGAAISFGFPTTFMEPDLGRSPLRCFDPNGPRRHCIALATKRNTVNAWIRLEGYAFGRGSFAGVAASAESKHVACVIRIELH